MLFCCLPPAVIYYNIILCLTEIRGEPFNMRAKRRRAFICTHYTNRVVYTAEFSKINYIYSKVTNRCLRIFGLEHRTHLNYNRDTNLKIFIRTRNRNFKKKKQKFKRF